MNKKIIILLAVLAALTLVFVACQDPVTEDTTPTVTDTPTDAPTDAPTEEATTPAETPTEETTTPEETPTTEEVTTEEVTTEEPTTEAPRYENLIVPQDQWVISGHKTVITTPDDSVHGGMITAGGVESAALLHQGSIALGEIDLSKYEKVVIMWGSDNGPGTQELYANNANNRFALVNANKHMQMSPAEDTIIAAQTYELHGWAVAPIEIDLSNVDYNGPVFLTHDSLEGGFALVYSIEFIGAVIPEGAETPDQGGNETPDQGGDETPDAPETYTVDLSTVTATGNWPKVDDPVPGSVFGRNHCIALHYGSVALGEIDLSKYSKVTVTYATPGEDMIGAAAVEEYNKTAKRVMLLNTPSAAEGTFECLPEESAIVADANFAETNFTSADVNGFAFLVLEGEHKVIEIRGLCAPFLGVDDIHVKAEFCSSFYLSCCLCNCGAVFLNLHFNTSAFDAVCACQAYLDIGFGICIGSIKVCGEEVVANLALGCCPQEAMALNAREAPIVLALQE